VTKAWIQRCGRLSLTTASSRSSANPSADVHGRVTEAALELGTGRARTAPEPRSLRHRRARPAVEPIAVAVGSPHRTNGSGPDGVQLSATQNGFRTPRATGYAWIAPAGGRAVAGSNPVSPIRRNRCTAAVSAGSPPADRILVAGTMFCRWPARRWRRALGYGWPARGNPRPTIIVGLWSSEPPERRWSLRGGVD